MRGGRSWGCRRGWFTCVAGEWGDAVLLSLGEVEEDLVDLRLPGGSQDLDLFLEHSFANSFMEPGVRYYVRLPAEDLLELKLEFYEIEKGFAVLELHEEIHVAVFPVIAAHYRPEQACPHHAMTPEGG